MNAIIVTNTSAKEIAALVLEEAGLEVQVQGRPSPKDLIADAVNQEINPCPNWSTEPVEEDQGNRSWRRFELHFTAGPERDELYRLLDRLRLSRRELALIVLGLRVRPGFSLGDFDT